MDEVRLPSRIVISGSSTISLSERFRQLKQAPKSSNNHRMSMREPRSFLYDDYMEDDLNERPSYGRSDLHARNEFGIGSSGIRGGNSRSRGVDFGLDDYSNIRRPTGGIRRRDDTLGDFGSPVGTGPQARRFASAMGIPSSRSQHTYDDLDYEPVPRGRLQQLVYRDAPPRAHQVVRRVVSGGRRDYLDDSRGEVVEIIERVRQPQRRVQVSIILLVI